mmetsp:Transcript_37977/g.82226  ORF Transcript_37977/g.82226 Transcript_37977/m.82226 type:complete len:562 (-) Transcript_37977:228-1913(-)|eukprot:CAMPEP_0206527562 /NCGR_PEP_ID=MMETSP0325_2-20121206/1420_1 /ASSEMBLY_ACC=CAM_ASM_000347 /TAXON_ID=2866 /ORGANISM="Crypthecodinium cohnii, Strain Seligo" /LENGTH=561 /DNA_ID=CAMNT_0054022991 /DNA_START=46 /DNA_END=1731 /DNA_ORIENTATION=+
MRICHGLLGETLETTEDADQVPLEVVRHHAMFQWQVPPEDLIILIPGGSVLTSTVKFQDLPPGSDVFIFRKSFLEDSAEEGTESAAKRADPEENPKDAKSLAALAEDLHLSSTEASQVEAEDVEACASVENSLRRAWPSAEEPLRAKFLNNITEARASLERMRMSVVLALRIQVRLEIQQLAIQVVLENLKSHRTLCSESLALFLRKHDKVQSKLQESLAQVPTFLETLRSVSLHPTLRLPGRETLGDAIPHERILRFTSKLQAERERCNNQLEKLKQQDAQVKYICDQTAGQVRQLLQDPSVQGVTHSIKDQHTHIVRDLLPTLGLQVSVVSSEPSVILEEERRCDQALSGIRRLSMDTWNRIEGLRHTWVRRIDSFIQRLREVSYSQSKVKSVERQAALLEEEVNAQRRSLDQIDHLQKLPKSYQKALLEVCRRHTFRERYMSTCEKLQRELTRMVEDENKLRRGFAARYGCHLPVDLVPGIGSMVPGASVEVPDFDSLLPLFEATEVDDNKNLPDARAAASTSGSILMTESQLGQSGLQEASANIGKTSGDFELDHPE